MAGDATSQLWLTHALNDDEVASALTLCFSLKKVLTARKLAVLVSSKVSLPLREALHLVFDSVFNLEEERNTDGLKIEDFAKLSALTFRSFEKIAFLPPTMMVLKNSDEIFNECNSKFQRYFWGEEGSSSVFVIRPCHTTFKVLMNELSTINGNTVEEYLRIWTKNQSGGTHTFLGSQYCHALSSQKEFLLEKGQAVSMINLVDIPFDLNAENYGLFPRLILENRTMLYNEAVKPLLQHVMETPNLVNHELSQPTTFNKEPIAIVGMSCRYPSANNLEEFWNLLVNAEDGTGNPPDFRWRREQSMRNVPDAKNTNAGFLKCPVDDFDAKFFNISPKEMVFLDPQHRLLHELVWEGLEDAAIVPESLAGTNGCVFVGSWTTDYRDILRHVGNDEFYRTYMGNSIGASAARISHFLGMTGPSIATESGCSSAMVAVHLACKSLQRGETNFALACGVNLLLHPFDKDLMPMVVSPDGHSKTFDASANGFARGEGCGVLVLKRLSDAVRDEDKIWALIRGSGMTQEGVSKSMGTPTVQCESMAMMEALQDARVDPAMVSYVEAHGTGTMVGDPMEVAAIAKAYHSDEREEPLFIGSVKTNVGHTESCSGITGIMKVVLAMQNEIIPAHRNFETLNPAIDLEAVPAQIPLKPVEWRKQEGKPRFAGVSSFGITGTDAHAIIEEQPTLPLNTGLQQTLTAEKPLQIMKICAKNEETLDILLESYKSHLKTTQEDFKDLAYTANVGRSDFSQRAILIAKSNEDALQRLEQNQITRGEQSPEAIGKVCFLFTGQGSQYPGMAKQLYETSPVFRMHFEYCEKILKKTYNIDITQVLWSEAKSAEVSRTIYSQTSIFCVEYALLKLWEWWGVKADYALGHSLGEFAAAVCAGILGVEDALKLVAERSRLIDELPRGKMLVIKADKQQVDTLMRKFAGNDKNKMLDYAAINSSEQTVVAGDSEVILHFGQFCKENNLKCIVLEATHAFHSKHMDPMLDEYRTVAKTLKKPNENDCKYISGMRGAVVEADQVGADYWVEHTREKVLFMDASKKAVELGCKTFIEIGPQPVLAALTMMNNDQALTCLPSLKKTETEWETLLTTVGKLYVKGLEIDWKGFEQFYDRKKTTLPHYPFSGKKFWPDVLSSTGVSIHPLLGSLLPNPSSLKLFQTGLNLRTLEYIKDHAIGDNVIFPGAGFLEMSLAAGLATIEGCSESLCAPTRAMKIENLTIEAPLLLTESSSTQLQTMTELNTSQENGRDWNDLSVKIFRNNSESAKWVLHSKATFCPLPTQEDKEECVLDTERFLATLDKPCEDPTLIKQVYDKLASVGLKFGPNFKSISTIWREEGSSQLLAKVKVPSDDGKNNYIIHPVVLDAMIQAIMMLRPISSMKKTLYVPIKIGKFLWLAPSSSSEELYIQAMEQGRNSTALLVDGSGKVLGLMSSVELVDTTVKAIESVLEQQTSIFPDLWEEVWRKTAKQPEFNLDDPRVQLPFFTQEYHEEFEGKFNNPSESRKDIFARIESLGYLYYVRTLHELGWRPELGQSFGESALFSELGIRPPFRRYFSFICDVLETEGILQKSKNGGVETIWKIIKTLPSNQEALALLSSPALSSTLSKLWEPTPLLHKLGENLASFFKGSVSPLSILFPEGKQEYPSLADYYLHYGELCHVTEFSPVCKSLLDHLGITPSSPVFEIKILEVGAGTGSFSQFIMDLFGKAENVRFEYTYTDISAAFFPAAEKRFEKYLKNIVFKKLNIEEDPLTQGFTPEYFDVVFAMEVIHATKDIAESLQNIRMLMKPEGKLVIQESTRVNRVHAFVFGPLEGYWRFEDLELRQNNCCTIEKEKWGVVLKQNGYGVEGIFSVFEDRGSFMVAKRVEAEEKSLSSFKGGIKTWLHFHQSSDPLSETLARKIGAVAGRKVIKVEEGVVRKGDGFGVRRGEPDDFTALFNTLLAKGVEIEGILYCWGLDKDATTPEELLLPLFNLMKSMLALGLKVTPRLSVITREVIPLEDNELSQFHKSILWGFAKSFRNENQFVNSRCIELLNGATLDKSLLQSLFHEVWSTSKETYVAISQSGRYIPKFQPHKPVVGALKLPPGTEKYQLVLPETKSISDLTFGPLTHPTELEETEVEIQVKASALNFRDVLSVIKPSEEFKNINMVGFDLAGVVNRVGAKVTRWKVGDQIMGCNMDRNSALPSHVRLSEEHLVPLPENMTLCEAATIPAVYVTSVVCLLDTAKIKKGEVVLLHTATGGVGLSAIEICRHVGATIIATAGSKRKQNYLRSIGIKHIFHSRNTQYGDQILELTNGRGVDVVLNSLTSEGFKEATLKACAKGARFVEMSKLNIWSVEDVKKLRPDVDYTIVDISSAEKSEWGGFLGAVQDLLEKGVVKPVPYVRFDGQNIREALQFMQKAKHIGKIVCVMPELRNVGGEVQVQTPMFSPNASYLITGGLGGIGFVVCKWMVELGAKHVILAGRSKPSPEIEGLINTLNSSYSANILAVQLDVGDLSQCEELLVTKMRSLGLPPLRGIMHAAGTLSDGLIVNQNWSKLSSTFNTKVRGTMNLHSLTKSLNLEHFVVFSSVAALFGSPGQSNHAAANAFLDSFVQYRHSIGLPATTVNWGQWGEVGVAVEMDIPGIKPFSTLQALAGLEYVMKTQRTQTAVLNVESFVMMSKISPQIAFHLDERVWKSSLGSTSATLIKSDEFWQQYDSLSESEGKSTLVRTQLHKILRNTLKMDEQDVVDDDTNLQEMGVDSLMFVEIKNGVQAMLGERLVVNASSIKDCNTVNLLVTTLVQLIEGEGDQDNVKPTAEQVSQLMREDCHLPENICAKPSQKIGNIKDVSTVLLTGATGTLGPYVLRELVAVPQLTKVICLIRPRKTESGEERLRKQLESLELKVDMKKIQVVSGDVGEPHLGMKQGEYEFLSEEVDAIIHCAAAVQHTEHYRKRSGAKDSRAVNIGGTKNVLEFACKNKLKHVFHASSILAVSTTDEEGLVSEGWPEMGEYDELTTFAYPISKFVGDILIKQAAERGIPAKVFRFPLIVGENKTGRCSLLTNHMLLRFMFIMKNGVMPSTPLPFPMLPVDICARVSVQIFFEEKATAHIYNLTHGQPDADQEFVNVAKKFGYDVELVELTEFVKRIQSEGEKDDSMMALFKDFYSDENALMSMYTKVPLFRKWVEGGDDSEKMWRCKNVSNIIPEFFQGQRPTMDYILDDLSFCKRQGWFDKFGL